MNNDLRLFDKKQIHLSYQLPINMEEQDRAHYKSLLQYEVKGATLESLYHVAIDHESLISTGLKVHPISFVHPHQVKRYYPNNKGFWYFSFKKYVLRIANRRSIAKGIWFIDNYSQTYFHWITEALPRLLSIQHLTNEIPIILPDYYYKLRFVKETLDILGIKNITLIPYKSILKVEHLLIPTQPAIPANYHPEAIKLLEYSMFKNIQNSIQEIPYIYISRKKAKHRRVINEQEVVEILAEFGFEEICLEDYSLQDQLSLISQAKMVITLHGAALANIAFMRPDSVVLELRVRDTDFWDCFYRLAVIKGIKYAYQICDVAKISNIPGYQVARHADVYVDTNQLLINVQSSLPVLRQV